MALRDCVNTLKGAGKLTDKQGEDILNKAARLENMYRASGKYSDADLGDKASRDALEGMLSDIKFAQYQEALTVEKLTNLRTSIDDNSLTPNNWRGLPFKFLKRDKGPDRAMVDELLATERTAQAISAQAMSKMSEFAEQFRSKVGGNLDKLRMFGGENIDLIRQVVRGLHGDTVGPEAKTFAGMYKEASDFIFNRKVRAGVNIHKLENFGISHRWDSAALKGKGKASFVRDAMQRLDRNRMVAPDGTPLDDANLTGVLGNVFNKLTGGPTQALPLEGQFLSRGHGTSLRSASESSRVLHFKTGEDWLQMHDSYGTGDLFETMLSQIDAGARDISLFERFGPNPQKVFDSLQAENKLKVQLAADEGVQLSTKDMVGTPQQMWNVLTGPEDDLINPKTAEVFAGIRNFQSAAKLGAAVLSNLTDQAFATVQMNRWGASYTGFVQKWFRQLRPGNKEDRAFAAEQLLGLQWAYNGVSSANRFGDTDAIGKFSGLGKRAADFTIRTSGLSSLNRASRSAAGLEINSHIARNAKSTWTNLDSKIKLGLQDGGIGQKEWNVIRNTTLKTKDGAVYIDMQKLLAKNEGVSTQFAAIIHGVIRKAAPEPDLQTRSITTGGGSGKGTIAREAASTLLQFKSFPISVMIQTVRDQMFDPRLAGLSSRLTDAAKLAIIASMWGGGIVQLKNIVAGRDFEDPTTLGFYLKAVDQGGSLGILSDGVKLASSGNRQRVAERLLPPAASMAIDLTIGLLGGSAAVFGGDYDKIGKVVIDTIKNETPGRTFYTKLAFERLIVDQMDNLVRPDAYSDWQRYQRSLAKRTGQGFWWSPGDALPERAPRVAEQP